MSITRRTLLLGAGTGAVAVLLAACTPEPDPQPSPTRTKTPMPRPTAPEDVPDAAGWVRSTWTTDRYSLGATSYLPAGAAPEQRDALAEPVLDRVFFAGEATDAAHPGTVLGAVDSGRRAGMGVVTAASDGERIAVIGAGAAGAVAARTIADAGYDVTVFEARERTGGRVHSADGDEWPVPVQLGAWLLGEDDLAALDSRLVPLPEDTVTFDEAAARSQDGQIDPVDGARVTQAIESAKERPSDLPLTEALDQDGADLEDPALTAALAWLSALTGADATRASSWYPPEFPSPPLTGLTGDLGAFIDETLEGSDLALASPVVRVAYDERGVSLRLGTGEAQSYDRVVVTVPLGVLQQQGVEFAPALPFAHRGALGQLATGAIEAVWLRFEEPFWDTEATIWQVVGGDALIRTWLNLQPGTGDAVLVGLVGGADAETFAGLSDDDALVTARASLAYFAPAPGEEG